MRYEWQYGFKSKSIYFDKVIRYGIDLKNGTLESTKLTQGTIEIRPNIRKESSTSSSGTVAISIPFNIDAGSPVAHKIAHDFSQLMCFEFGDFQINWAILVCERIPETNEEKEEIGELTHLLLQLSFRTVPEGISFDKRSINGLQLPRYNQVLMELFNNAEQKTDLVDKYLTRFKIVETEFIDNASRVPAKTQLKNAPALFNAFYSIALNHSKSRAVFDDLVDRFVDARGECAHLKNYNYGFFPRDPRLKQLEVLEMNLRELCRALIKSV
jgi:hypothetical protein